MKPPDVVIVITCFNHGHFLAEAIDSALDQTCPAAQIIVVDDGSTDSTAAVAARYDQVRYVWQANAGLSAARNTGLARAEGEFIMFLDADDLLLPNAIADALKAFQSNPHAVFVYGGYREVGPERAFLWETLPRRAEDSYAELLRGNHIAMHGTVMYRVEAIRDAGGYDASLRRCEDYDLYLRMSRTSPIADYQSISAEYRRHGDNMTGASADMLRTALLVLSRQKPYVGGRPDWRRAYEAGRRFWQDYYGPRVVGQIKRDARAAATRGRALRSFAIGLQYDRLFLRRLAGRVLARAPLMGRLRKGSAA